MSKKSKVQLLPYSIGVFLVIATIAISLAEISPKAAFIFAGFGVLLPVFAMMYFLNKLGK